MKEADLEAGRPKGWWGRNWKWFVPAGCLTLLLGFGAFIALILMSVSRMMKSSDAYQLAMARAKANPAVVQALGEPLKEGLFTSGSINISGPSGSADLAIPVQGPKGKGTVYVQATKGMGQWSFRNLVVEVDVSGQRIDLLKEAPGEPAP